MCDPSITVFSGGWEQNIADGRTDGRTDRRTQGNHIGPNGETGRGLKTEKH